VNLQAIELARVAHRQPLSGIRWTAVFGGVVVGLASYVLLMLIGVCAGMAAGDGDVSGAVLAWNLASALIAAMLGAFVTARAADLRRQSDGALHGLVVWGAATVLGVLLAVLALRDVAGGMLLVMAQQQADRSATAQLDRYDPWRNGTVSVIQTGGGDRSDLPRRTAQDWVRAPVVAEAPAAQAQMALPAYASLMLCAALAMALFGGLAGGLLGTQRPRRADPMDQSNWRDVVEHLDI